MFYNIHIIYKEINKMTKERNMTRLNFQFDTIYDIKFMYEIEAIAKGEASHSDASPEDLVDMFEDLGETVPDCLSEYRGTSTIWILPDGTWLPYEPLSHEEPNAQKVKINKFDS